MKKKKTPLFNIGNDGTKHPRPQQNETVEFLPTHHVYTVGDIPKTMFRRENWEQLLLELGSQGMDGFLITSILESQSDPTCFTIIFAKTGIRTPVESPIKLV